MDEEKKASSALRREALPPRRLARVPSLGPCAGVCAGLARHLGWKPWKLRTLLVLSSLLLAGGPLVAYVAAVFVLPADPA